MNIKAKEYLENLFDKVTEKDYKVTEQDFKNLEETYKEHGVVFPSEIKEFYLRYNEVIKYNVCCVDVPYYNDPDPENCYSRITIKPLLSRDGICKSSVEFTLRIVVYDGYNTFLKGLIPIATDMGGAIICYKIDDGSIILYYCDLEDENDYRLVVDNFDELFDYIEVDQEVK